MRTAIERQTQSLRIQALTFRKMAKLVKAAITELPEPYPFERTPPIHAEGTLSATARFLRTLADRQCDPSEWQKYRRLAEQAEAGLRSPAAEQVIKRQDGTSWEGQVEGALLAAIELLEQIAAEADELRRQFAQ